MYARFSQEDYTSHRISGGFGYILFFLPLVLCPQSRYGRFCANQGLLGLIAILLVMLSGWVLRLVIGWIPLIGTLVQFFVHLVRIIISLIMMFHMYLAIFKNYERELPIIGSITILR